MPTVSKCDVIQCCYNNGLVCHALAITIGDGAIPECDTFTTGCKSKAGDSGATAGVGACKVSACTFNKNLECIAPTIVVGHGAQVADCLTFRTT